MVVTGPTYTNHPTTPLSRLRQESVAVVAVAAVYAGAVGDCVGMLCVWRGSDQCCTDIANGAATLQVFRVFPASLSSSSLSSLADQTVSWIPVAQLPVCV
ncbi:hypothetical protein BaRGS_00006387 [Batillaria attramentaria]|uniref:Hydrophobin n=1 Tax=Batillaria attramentaria TaxID=370345 RepID=A0ABD0LTV5_9CAEN